MFSIKPFYEFFRKLLFIFFIVTVNSQSIIGAYAEKDDNALLGVNLKEFSGVEDNFGTNGEAGFTVDTLLSDSNDEKIILRLTNRKSNVDGNVAGSAFVKKKFIPQKRGDYAFSTFFRLRITGNTVNDGAGIVFVIHADSRGVKAMGKKPMGMGYSGETLRGYASIIPSIGIKFNAQDVGNDLDINSVGTVVNGSLRSIYPPHGYPLIDGRFNDGVPLNVWIDYDGTFLIVHTSRNSKRSNAVLHTKRMLNLRKILNSKLSKNKAIPNVYVGFTADPGFQAAYHDILEWYFHPYHRPFGNYCHDMNNKKCDMFRHSNQNEKQ